MVLNSALPRSVISPTMRDLLTQNALLIPSIAGATYRVSRLTSQGQVLPDLDVSVARHLTRLGLDGMLGLDFLFHFEHVHFQVSTLRLILTNPTNGAGSA